MIAFFTISTLAFIIALLVALNLFKNIHWNFKANSWLIGITVFIFNTILFFSVMFVYFNTSISILKFAFIPVVLSIFVWFAVGETWRGSKTERRRVALIGSSIYWVLLCYFLYRRITLKPKYTGEDLFMAAIGLDIGLLVVGIAAISCTFILGWKRKISDLANL